MFRLILYIIAYTLMLVAASIGRDETSKIITLSTDWWIIIGLITIGGIILSESHRIERN